MNISHNTVANGVRQTGKKSSDKPSPFFKPKPLNETNSAHLWAEKTIRCGLGWPSADKVALLSVVVGDRTDQTAEVFWKQVQARLGDKGSETRFYADHYEVYRIIVPAKQLVQSKKETYTVEGQNSLIRHFLAQFHRRTFCYSKSLEMLTYSLARFVYHRNHKSAILAFATTNTTSALAMLA